ncbi:hypothetical protein MRB53_038739 [Persea americana]|nr:hypothetical protein MRB53_038739 [Persea americana]
MYDVRFTGSKRIRPSVSSQNYAANRMAGQRSASTQHLSTELIFVEDFGGSIRSLSCSACSEAPHACWKGVKMWSNILFYHIHDLMKTEQSSNIRLWRVDHIRHQHLVMDNKA